MTRRELVLVGLLISCLLLGTGAYWWRTQASAKVLVPLPAVQAAPSAKSDDKPSSMAKSADITVHINGSVRQPGLYTLAGGSRMSDAIRAAGGSLPEADLDAVNLAAVILDGQKYTIPMRGQVAQTNAAVSAAAPAAGEKINVNVADSKSLEQLPGIGEARAKAIVEFRQKNGAFQSVEDLKKISGIGDKILEQLRDRVTTR